jgi:hypothetical protein
MTILLVDPNFSLTQLNQFVSQSENGLLGPLISIGNHNKKTVIEINDLDPAGPPPKPSVITTGGPPAGATTIGVGQVYISGTLTQATAYKPP